MKKKNKKILIAEDDPTSRMIMVKVIENLGYTVIQARTGQRAFNMLEDNPDVDMLITDLMMPELDGRNLVQILRANETFSRLPILMVSAVVPLREIYSVMELGATRFLPKPVKVKELKEYITTLLDK